MDLLALGGNPRPARWSLSQAGLAAASALAALGMACSGGSAPGAQPQGPAGIPVKVEIARLVSGKRHHRIRRYPEIPRYGRDHAAGRRPDHRYLCSLRKPRFRRDSADADRSCQAAGHPEDPGRHALRPSKPSWRGTSRSSNATAACTTRRSSASRRWISPGRLWTRRKRSCRLCRLRCARRRSSCTTIA